ncbi:AAA family ATPase [Streptomyces sp. NPDC002994]|uniref:AAA family ATPase n=1 Tax=Streptomyces sp. NPDC002994 TaxID=3154441 RepID=UPI0033AAB39B
MPFGRDLAPGMLHRHASHNEAVARITWCITERSIGVVTGEVGAGKTVSVRTVLHGIDPSKHTVIYLPNPMIRVRGIHEAIVTAFGQQPSHLGSRLTAQTGLGLAAERDERGRTPAQLRTARSHPDADQHGHGPGLAAGLPAGRPADPAADHETRRPGRA